MNDQYIRKTERVRSSKILLRALVAMEVIVIAALAIMLFSRGKSMTRLAISGQSLLRCSTPEISELSNEPDGVKVTWEKVDGAKAYRVFCRYGEESWKMVGDTEETSFLATTRDGKNAFKTCNKYWFAVRCLERAGSYSYTSDFDTEGKAWRYTAVTSITRADNLYEGTITLAWEEVQNSHGYMVQYSVNPDFSEESRTAQFKKGTTVSGEINGLTQGNAYYLRIQSYVKYEGVVYYSAWSTGRKVEITN